MDTTSVAAWVAKAREMNRMAIFVNDTGAGASYFRGCRNHCMRYARRLARTGKEG